MPRLHVALRMFISVGSWVSAVGSWVAALLLVWEGWSSDAELLIPFAGFTRDVGMRLSADLPAGVTLAVRASETDLTVPHLPVWLHVLTFVPQSVTAAAVGVGTLLVRRIVLSIIDGNSFDAGNPRRFAWLAALVFGAGVVNTTLNDAVTERVLRDLADSGRQVPIMFEPQPTAPCVAVALGLLLLAWAFRRGLQVSRDAEGLV